LIYPRVASGVEFDIGFTVLSTDSRTENTTVVMIIQNMLVRANLATRRLFKSDRELFTNNASRDLVRNLNRLKPHSVVDVIGLVRVKDFLVHGSQ